MVQEIGRAGHIELFAVLLLEYLNHGRASLGQLDPKLSDVLVNDLLYLHERGMSYILTLHEGGERYMARS